MMDWHIHFLNARHGLTSVMPEIRAAVRQAVAQVSAFAALPPVDVVVRPGAGIAEWGVAGLAPAPGVIELTVDPARFDPDRAIRTLIHEMHHLIRWDGPGYGRTLGEALVSEGLAGHFVLEVMGGPPDPWDRAPVGAALARRAITDWSRPGYDHAAWFFGQGDLRRWAGYGLGHLIMAEALADAPGETSVTLSHAAAETFRPVLRRLASRLDPETPPDDAAPQEDAPQLAPSDESETAE